MRRVLIAVTALLLVATRAQTALGQCNISMIDMNGTPMLCADIGDAWEWTGPGGFTSTDMCVIASTNGTYTLRVFDAASNSWSAPCSQLVGPPPQGPPCSITGADSVCAGSSVQWCGPTGDFTYAWSGPGGFTSTSACVDVSAAGTYSLALTDRASGAAGDPCSLTLRSLNCVTPGGGSSGCPRSAHWWASGCGAPVATVDADAFAHVAADVDSRSAVLNFGGTPQGLCSLFDKPRRGTPMAAACRQYAAVLANIAAMALGVHDYEGHGIGLDPSQELNGVRGIHDGTTLSSWVQSTETTLLGLGSTSGRNGRSSRETLRRIRWEAREINRGRHSGTCSEQLNAMIQDDDDDDFGADAPEQTSAVATQSSGASDPLSGGQRMRWTLLRSAQVDLAVVDVTGRHVRHLASGMYAAGTHDWSWDGRDDDGRAMRAGAYFVTGSIGGERTSQRFFILR